MNERKRIIILGGGYAGVAAAKHLVKKVGKNRNIEITLIDRNRYQTLMTELHEVAGGRVEQGAVQVSFAKIFGGRPIALVQDDIETIDFKNQIIVSPKAKYPYDYLLLGVGGEPEDFGTPGIAKHAFTLWSLDDALKLREHIERMFFLPLRSSISRRGASCSASWWLARASPVSRCSASSSIGRVYSRANTLSTNRK
jgi:NADH dehydrogenase